MDDQAKPARPQLRTLIGVLGIVVYLTVYCLLIMALVATWMVDKPIWLQTTFYAIAGVSWLPPTRWILGWMARR
ncbi:DUF2842 domain-containing protein [Tepidamorphus sp. 3E244]|uniref:DUF2842 domain-containing protein n=1 Tax=Tepidamorphus sp. 3E244 TaxID=3385498 RepID=UPI0038FD2977